MAKVPEVARLVVHTADAPAAIGPYSQGIRVGNQLWVSGCIGLDPKTMDFTSATVEGQCTRTLDSLKAVVEAGGSSLANVVKTTILLRDMNDFAKVNAIYAKYFPLNPPARATYAVAGLPKNALIEIECVAIVPVPTAAAAAPASTAGASSTSSSSSSSSSSSNSSSSSSSNSSSSSSSSNNSGGYPTDNPGKQRHWEVVFDEIDKSEDGVNYLSHFPGFGPAELCAGLRDLCSQCLQTDPLRRPNFDTIVQQLQQLQLTLEQHQQASQQEQLQLQLHLQSQPLPQPLQPQPVQPPQPPPTQAVRNREESSEAPH